MRQTVERQHNTWLHGQVEAGRQQLGRTPTRTPVRCISLNQHSTGRSPITGNVDALGELFASCSWLIKPSAEPNVLLLLGGECC
ncbi:hypothetical protein E0K94_15145 [Escherichia coli]|nr:hypothetical protein E0K94_15145 [Escherichia coli]